MLSGPHNAQPDTERAVDAADIVVFPLALSTDANDINMNKDVVAGDIDFQYVVPAGTSFHWVRMTWQIEAGNLSDFSEWGPAGTLASDEAPCIMITDGSDVTIEDFETVTKAPLISIGRFHLLVGPDVVLSSGGPPGDDTVSVRWTMSKCFGGPVVVPTGYKIKVVLRNGLDLSSLSIINAEVHGHLIRL